MKSQKARARAALCAAGVMVLAWLCPSRVSANPWEPPRPVITQDSGEWISLFPSWVTYLSAGSGAGGVLLLRDGDLVSDGPFFFIYRSGDGTALSPVKDEGLLLLAGRVVALSLDQEAGAWDWLETASAAEMESVRSVWIGEGADTARLPLLKKLGAVNPDVALWIESSRLLVEVLPLVRPRTLFLAFTLDAQAIGALEGQQQLDTLCLSAGLEGSLDFLAGFPRLRRLAVGSLDTEKAGGIPGGLRGLKRLLLVESRIKDASDLANIPPELEELSLLGCETSFDAGSLARFSDLRTLILNASADIGDLSALRDLKQLEWVGLPPEISQEQLSIFVGQHRGLKVLEMVSCRNVKDLSPLRDLASLEALILGGPAESLETVAGLKTLKLVGILHDVFQKSPEQVAALKRSLPDAVIAPIGVCLGSGWILLLIPAAALGWLVRSRIPSRAAEHRRG